MAFEPRVLLKGILERAALQLTSLTSQSQTWNLFGARPDGSSDSPWQESIVRLPERMRVAWLL
eukprot:3883908-Amphidinium_carterae.1